MRFQSLLALAFASVVVGRVTLPSDAYSSSAPFQRILVDSPCVPQKNTTLGIELQNMVRFVSVIIDNINKTSIAMKGIRKSADYKVSILAPCLHTGTLTVHLQNIIPIYTNLINLYETTTREAQIIGKVRPQDDQDILIKFVDSVRKTVG
jgi:hypothetical protein